MINLKVWSSFDSLSAQSQSKRNAKRSEKCSSKFCLVTQLLDWKTSFERTLYYYSRVFFSSSFQSSKLKPTNFKTFLTINIEFDKNDAFFAFKILFEIQTHSTNSIRFKRIRSLFRPNFSGL